MKRLFATLTTISLVFSGAVAANAANAADAYSAEATTVPKGGAVFLVAEEGNFMPVSTLAGHESNSHDSNAWACNGALDPKCAIGKANDISGNALLPVCDSDRAENCIVSFEIAGPGKDFEKASYVRKATGQTFPAVLSVGYIGGSTASLWEAPGTPSASGTTSYAVIANVQTSRRPNGKWETGDFMATVVPYRAQTGDYRDPEQMTANTDDVKGTRTSVFGIGYNDQRCAWNEKGTCGVVQDFVEGTRVRLTVRMSSSIGGWFKGRLKNPLISVSKYSAKNNQVTVEAEPATVTRMSYTVQDNKILSAEEEKFVKQNGFGGGRTPGFVTWAPAWQGLSFSYVDYFRNKVKDTASGVNSYWNFGSNTNQGGTNRCLDDKSKVLGIVTTNSMIYAGGVPKFENGFLNYKVAGLHYMPNGTDLAVGVYDMVMRSDVARCLYGFSKAPLSATVSVVSDQGEKSTATTVVSEKNGWLKLAAYGFTFSNKTIKVKITKKKK